MLKEEKNQKRRKPGLIQETEEEGGGSCDAIRLQGRLTKWVGLKSAQEERLRREASNEKQFGQGLRGGES